MKAGLLSTNVDLKTEQKKIKRKKKRGQKNIKMKVKISKHNTDPANTLIDVYSHNTRPFCRMYEEDFAELLSETDIARMENGETNFDVNKHHLIINCKTYFGNE